jgi:phosphocarrier protein
MIEQSGDSMFQSTVIIINELGLHARPGSNFVRRAGKFKSQINVTRAGSDVTANAKSIISVLSLVCTRGTAVTISASGEDEQEAVKDLIAFIESGLDE